MKIDKKILVLAMIMVLMIVLGGWRNLRPGIEVGDEFFVQKSAEYYKKGNDEIRLIKGDGFTDFQMVIDGTPRNANLVWSKRNLFDVEYDYAEIKFEDATIEGYWFESNMLVDNKGVPLIYRSYPISVTVNGEKVPISNVALSNILCRLDLGMVQKNGSGAFIILAIVVYVIGALTFLYPEKMFFLGSRWQFKNPELSEDGKMMEQFGGVVLMIVGFVIALNISGLR